MQYMLLIYENEANWADMPEEQVGEVIGQYQAYGQHLVENGHFKVGEALQPTPTATTVRVRDGESMLTDGPFAETKEQLGGFYLVEAADLDEAVALAARCPGARTGCVEVRPVMVFEEDGGS